jgi:peptidoglycan/LPS O-acetylase OafA/YrhL
VLVFFVLSGYAIHYRQAQRIASGQSPVIAWPTFAFHRMRRLYPPLLASLVLAVVLDALGTHITPALYHNTLPPQFLGLNNIAHPDTLLAFVGSLFFLQGFITPLYGSTVPLWSLAYEGFFYAAYPAVLFATRRFGPLRCLELFFFLGVAAAAVIGLGGGINALGPRESFGVAASGGLLALLPYWTLWVAGAFIADCRAGPHPRGASALAVGSHRLSRGVLRSVCRPEHLHPWRVLGGQV